VNLPAFSDGQEPSGGFQNDSACIKVHQSSKVQCQQHKKQEKDNTVAYSEIAVDKNKLDMKRDRDPSETQ
jgi:hypothetical protein